MASDSNGNQWYQPTAGLNNVGSYQVAAIPWATGSISAPELTEEPLKISFPSVTNFFIVKNDSTSASKLRVGFSRNGIIDGGSNNYFLLSQGESFEGNMRIVDLYLLSDDGIPVDVTVVAGLTGINRSNLANNWSGSVGVG